MRSCAAVLTSSVGVPETTQVTHDCKPAEEAALQIHDVSIPQPYTSKYILSIERESAILSLETHLDPSCEGIANGSTLLGWRFMGCKKANNRKNSP